MRNKLMAISVIFSILSSYLALFPMPIQAANFSATWTTKGDFENNASTSGSATTRSLVEISGINQEDDADITLSHPIDFNKKTLAGGYSFSVGVNADGTATAVGDNSYNQLNVGSWSDMNSVAAGYYHTLGLKNDGTVTGVGNNSYGQLNVGLWNNIKAIASGKYHTVGLKNDGTVLAIGNSDYLKLNVGSWTNIKAISAGYDHTVGLRNDGTVAAVGNNPYGQRNVGSWTDIKAIAAGGYHTVGLKNDGTVVAVGNADSGISDAGNWTDIKAIAAGGFHTVGLKNDGTVVAAGYNVYGQLNVEGWTDIVDIAAGTYHTLGLKSDGTILAVGRNNSGQLNVAGWDIDIPISDLYEATGTVSGFKIDSGELVGDWSNISWQATTPANTGVKFRTRGADTEQNLSLASWSDYYSVSGSTITTLPSRWLEVEATLESSSGINTPVLGSLNVDYQQNGPPVFNLVGNQDINVNQLLNFSVSAVDPDGDPLNYSAGQLINGELTNLPTGATFDSLSREFSWTPGVDQAGDYIIRFQADDGTTTVNQDITINVNGAPVLNAIPNQQLFETELLQLDLSSYSSDPNGDTLTYSVSNLPSGSSIDTSTGAFSWTPTYDQAGTYNVDFTVSDGNLSDTKTVQINVDNKNRAPDINLPTPLTFSEGDFISFAIGPLNDADGDTVTYSSTILPQGASIINGNTFTWIPSSSQAGTYPITFEATDGDLADSQDVMIIINNINRPPVLDVIGNKETNEGELLAFTVNATDPDGDMLTYSALNLPQGSSFDTETLQFSWTPGLDQSGSFENIQFVVTDGEYTDSETISITVSDTNRAPVLNTIPNQQVIETELLQLSLSSYSSDPDSDTLTYSASNKPDGMDINENTGAVSFTPAYYQAGIYSVDFTVSDGNLSDTKTVQITVDNKNRPPVLEEIFSPQFVDEGDTLIILLFASDPDGDQLTYIKTSGPGEMSDNVYTWTPDYNQAGSYTVTYTVSDGDLTDSQDVVINVSNTNRAPVFNPIPNQQLFETELLALNLSSYNSDPDGDTLTYSASNLPSGASLNTNTGAFSWAPTYDQAGTYNVIFTVFDGSLTETETAQIIVDNKNRAPDINLPTPLTFSEGDFISFAIGPLNDADGDTVTYSSTILPQGASIINGNTFTWIPSSSQAGTYPITFEATDGDLADSQDVVFNVNNLNRPPVLDSIGNKAINEGEPLTFTVNAIDPDGDMLTYSALNLPQGSSFDTETLQFNWTPGLDQSGSFENIQFEVTDGEYTDSETISINVSNTNRAPVLNTIPNQQVIETELLQLSLSSYSSDPDSDTLTYSASNKPDGMDINENTGAVSYTPTYDQAGTYDVIFAITDGSLTDTETVRITVEDKNRAPVLDEITTPQSVAESSTLNIDANASDPDSDTITFSATGLPDGATIDSATGEIAYTPGYDVAPNSFTVNVTATDNATPNISDSQDIVINVTNTNRAPVLSAILNREVVETELFALGLSSYSSDPDGDPLTSYSVLNKPEGMDVDPVTGAVTWTPTYEQAGTYDIDFTVSDGELSDTKTVQITVDNKNRLPALEEIITPQSVAEGAILNIDVDASDLDSDTITYSAVGLPVGVNIDPGTGVISYSPGYDEAPRSYNVTVTATDNGTPNLSVPQDIVINVTNTNRRPVVNAGGPYQIFWGQDLNLNAGSSSDPDGDTLTFDWDLNNDGFFDIFDQPANMTAPFAVLPKYPGTYTVNLRAYDNAAYSDTVTAQLTILQNPAEAKLVADYSPKLKPEVGQEIIFDAGGSDPGSGNKIYKYEFDFNYKNNIFTNDYFETRHNAKDGRFDGKTKYTYKYPGIYTVAVRVTVYNGNAQTSDIETITLEVICNTKTTLSAIPIVIKKDKSSVIKGQLKDIKGRVLSDKHIEIKAGNKVIKIVETNKKGYFAYRVKPHRSKYYKAVYKGSRLHRRSSSKSIRLIVK